MQIRPNNGTQIRQQAEQLRKKLETKSQEWTNTHEPSSSSYDGVATDHFWKQNAEGDALSGWVSRKDGEIERYGVGLRDKTESGTVKTEYAMRSCPPPSWTAGVGEALTNVGFSLGMGVPGGFLIGMPLMAAGRWLTFDNSEPNLQIFSKSEDYGPAEYAVFDSKGQYLGDEVRSSQKVLFS